MKTAGIDGCRGGWLVVLCRGRRLGAAVLFPHISQFWSEHADVGLALIDIPIGLPEAAPRRCDSEARRLLGPRRASVFPVPCREAVEAPDYATASEINLQRLGRRLTRQSWNICPKIRQVDHLLRSDTEIADRLRESHPELCFRALAGGMPLPHSKRTGAGRKERLELLCNYAPEAQPLIRRALGAYPRARVALDDILDALVLALGAAAPKLRSLPEPPQQDAAGLPMGIVYPEAEG